MIKRVAGCARGLVKVALAAIHKKDVHPAVAVVIDKSNAWSKSFWKIALGRHSAVVNPMNAAFRWSDFFEPGRRLCTLAHRQGP